MKLLLDQNLPPRIARSLVDLFPDSAHVAAIRLDRASDEEVWVYARTHGFAVVTKDADFSDLSSLRGAPPKVVWIRRGNCTTRELEGMLRSEAETIRRLGTDEKAHVLVL